MRYNFSNNIGLKNIFIAIIIPIIGLICFVVGFVTIIKMIF